MTTLRRGAVIREERLIPNTCEAIRKLVAGLGDPALLWASYEAGPTGYDSHRLLSSPGAVKEARREVIRTGTQDTRATRATTPTVS